MKLGRPGGLSAAGKKELWERWRAGESISDIARALRKPPGSIYGMLRATGGFSPPEQRRRRCALTPVEREEVSRGLAAGESLRAIAARLDRSASTVCREVGRNGGRGRYRATKADEKAWERARRPKRCLLATNGHLRDVVAKKLKEDWSPEQISGWLKRRYPDDEAMRVSHETIYRTLFVQSRGALKRELLAHLRSRRMMRRVATPPPPVSRADRSKKPSRSENVRWRQRIERCPDTGKVISSPDRATPTSLPWSSAARGS